MYINHDLSNGSIGHVTEKNTGQLESQNPPTEAIYTKKICTDVATPT